jgi:putative FmdB family regulatory protein
MPLFDFECRECRERFEELVSSGTKVVCPGCGSADLAKLWSPFAVGRGGRSSASAPRCEPAIAAGGG